MPLLGYKMSPQGLGCQSLIPSPWCCWEVVGPGWGWAEGSEAGGPALGGNVGTPGSSSLFASQGPGGHRPPLPRPFAVTHCAPQAQSRGKRDRGWKPLQLWAQWVLPHQSRWSQVGSTVRGHWPTHGALMPASTVSTSPITQTQKLSYAMTPEVSQRTERSGLSTLGNRKSHF